MRECAGGPLGALSAPPRLPRPQCPPPPPRVQRPPWGDAGPPSLWPAPVRCWGGGGGERGGGPGPLKPPPDGREGAAWRFRPRGASCRLGGRTLPPPPSTL